MADNEKNEQNEQNEQSAAAHGPVGVVTDENFIQEVIESGEPVVVDFYADWCGPCHMMAPTLDDFAKQHAGTALVLKLDTEAEPTIAARYGIRGIPTLIDFDQGKEKARHVGVADLKTLEKLVGVSAG